MNWFLLALLAGTASNIFNIFNRSSLKERGDSTLYSWFFELVRFFIFFAYFLTSPAFPTHLSTYMWLAALGCNEAFSVYFFMKSHRHTKLSVSTFIIKLQLIWTPLLASLFIGERLSMRDYTGIAVVLLGIGVGIYNPKMKPDKGTIITLISSFFIALNAVFTKGAADGASTPFLMMCMSLPAALFFPFLMKQFRHRAIHMSRQFILNSISGIVFNIIAMTLAVSAIRLGSTSKVTAVYQAMMIIAIIYGVIFLKERENIPQKLAGSAITVLGLFLLL
jgi:drug/metabolite transporter (DMT)-like permease